VVTAKMIKIFLSQPFSYHANNEREVEVRGGNIGECLAYLVEQYPDIKNEIFNQEGVLHYDIDLYVNRQSIAPIRLDMKITDGDEIYMLAFIDDG